MPDSTPNEAPAQGMSARDYATVNDTLQEPYTPGPDSQVKDGVPQGKLTKFHHVGQKIYPGVERDYWVYDPQQYDASQPAALMVFQDGAMYLGPEVNPTTVF